MRVRFLTLLQFLFLASTLLSAKQRLNESYAVIARIQSPYEMVSTFFPKRYSVHVTLSGSIADEINAVLDTINIDKPLYSEYYDRKNGFKLCITNEQFPSQTREMISGILNPIDMTGVILNSFLKYRETANLFKIQNETNILKKNEVQKNRPVIIIEIKPKGTRFCYEYKDFGAYLHESWLSELSLVIDSSTMLASELSIIKHICVYNTNQQKRPLPKKFHHRYVFSYTKVENSLIPSRLDLYIDSIMTLTFSASYHQIDKYVLFDKREIKYFLSDNTTSELVVNYKKYTFNVERKALKENNNTEGYSKKLRRAAAYSRKATEALNKGRIQTAAHIMQTIINNYPDTPQAVEAQKLLSGLQIGL